MASTRALADRVRSLAAKAHPQAEVAIGRFVVEVLLPEDAGLVFNATEGTVLVADLDRFGSLHQALRATLEDLKAGVRPGSPHR